jgi:hypothetical protein
MVNIAEQHPDFPRFVRVPTMRERKWVVHYQKQVGIALHRLTDNKVRVSASRNYRVALKKQGIDTTDLHSKTFDTVEQAMAYVYTTGLLLEDEEAT